MNTGARALAESTATQAAFPPRAPAMGRHKLDPSYADRSLVQRYWVATANVGYGSKRSAAASHAAMTFTNDSSSREQVGNAVERGARPSSWDLLPLLEPSVRVDRPIRLAETPCSARTWTGRAGRRTRAAFGK